jgi:hypothetical protein
VRAGVPVRAVRGERGLGVPPEGAREDARHRGHAVQPLRQGGQGQGCLLPPYQFNVPDPLLLTPDMASDSVPYINPKISPPNISTMMKYFFGIFPKIKYLVAICLPLFLAVLRIRDPGSGIGCFLTPGSGIRDPE